MYSLESLNLESDLWFVRSKTVNPQTYSRVMQIVNTYSPPKLHKNLAAKDKCHLKKKTLIKTPSDNVTITNSSSTSCSDSETHIKITDTKVLKTSKTSQVTNTCTNILDSYNIGQQFQKGKLSHLIKCGHYVPLNITLPESKMKNKQTIPKQVVIEMKIPQSKTNIIKSKDGFREIYNDTILKCFKKTSEEYSSDESESEERKTPDLSERGHSEVDEENVVLDSTLEIYEEEELEDNGSSITPLDPIKLISTDKVLKHISSEKIPPIKTVLPALRSSIFSNVPPTINFCSAKESIEPLPYKLQRLLRWRMSPITPNIVRETLLRSGFRTTPRNHDWIGYWGKHMKAKGFGIIRQYQKVNHYPGTFQLGRKDRLWQNLCRMQMVFGKVNFNFMPQTFILPGDLLALRKLFGDDISKDQWIVKPPASARGNGIKVIHKWKHIPRKKTVIVQKYISKPYLINDKKFDLRIYVYVTCYDPLRIYVFNNGLVRFASVKYSQSCKFLSNRYMHLTNYSINRLNIEYSSGNDELSCEGHKWSLQALWGYLKVQGINTSELWDKIKDIVIKTIISSDSMINSLIKLHVKNRYCCHELFGFDIILDEYLKPWLVEVNISPSLHSSSQLDIIVKGSMVKDLLNMAGFHLPDKKDMTVMNVSVPMNNTLATNTNISSCKVLLDKRLFTQVLSSKEKAKHLFYVQKHVDKQCGMTILDNLTPDDVRMLIEMEDELYRCGNFERIFPSSVSNQYLQYFEVRRYYNLLLNEWVQTYHKNPRAGIELLDTYCQHNYHLQSIDHYPFLVTSPSLQKLKSPDLISAK